MATSGSDSDVLSSHDEDTMQLFLQLQLSDIDDFYETTLGKQPIGSSSDLEFAI